MVLDNFKYYNNVRTVSVDDFNSISSGLVIGYVNEGELDVKISDSQFRILKFTLDFNSTFSCHFRGNLMVIDELPFSDNYEKVGFNVRVLKALSSLLSKCEPIDYLFIGNVIDRDLISAMLSLGFVEYENYFYLRVS